jgi:hypothetical protein
MFRLFGVWTVLAVSQGAPSTLYSDFLKQLASPDPDLRVRAVETARRERDPRMLHALIPSLGDPHPKVRLRSTEALKEAGAEEVARAALRHPSPLVRQGACEALVALGRPVLDRLTDPDPRVRAAAARQKDAPPDRLIAAFRKESDWPLRAAVLESLRRPELLDEASADRHYPVRLVAAEIRPTAALLADADWRVRAAAIEGTLAVRERALVDPLIARLAEEKGRLRWDALLALQDLTGKDLGLGAAAWKAWWDANRETFALRPAGKGAIGVELAGTQAAFFNVPILSTRLVFVLDLSGSMREPSPRGGTKLDVAKAGMIETIRSLPPEARFAILGLGCDEDGAFTKKTEKTWTGRLRLVPAQPAARADAERFIRSLDARGWTNLYDGLAYALEDPDVDTVYLYSDGGASKGTFVAAGEILSQLSLANRFRKIVVHTVEVPGEKNPEDNRRLLSKIASSTKGTFQPYERKE